MTAPAPEQVALVPSQRAREAAADFCGHRPKYSFEWEEAHAIRRGERDDWGIVQAFARFEQDTRAALAPPAGDGVREALKVCFDALLMQHAWQGAQTTPDPEFGYIPADEYGDSAMCEYTMEAIGTARAALATPSAPEAPPPVAGEVEVVEWAREEGRDDGATFCIETLARQLKVDNYEQADGSETWEGDVSGTLLNVLRVARIYDDEDGAIARLPEAAPPPPPASDPVVERARNAVERLANTRMELSLEDWSSLSNDILAALSQRAGLDAGVREQGQREGWAAAQAWLRDRGAQKPRASLWAAAETLAERMDDVHRALAAQPSGSDGEDRS